MAILTNDKQRIDWLRLIRAEKIGPKTFWTLLERCKTIEEAIRTFSQSKVAGQKSPSIPSKEEASYEIEQLRSIGGELILYTDKAYPPLLRTISDPPPVLSVLGKLGLLLSPCFAIVGARNASLHGQDFAMKLAKELGRAGFIICSGLAKGIDTAAHMGSLASGTLAVVASGINIVYPKSNEGLYRNITQDGVVISEYPFNMDPQATNFHRRNRIISGIAHGTIVVEAARRSGSLITAHYALEQGRDVFAVPGFPGDPRYEGCNDLIRQGATLLQSFEDALETSHQWTSFYRSSHKEGEAITLPFSRSPDEKTWAETHVQKPKNPLGTIQKEEIKDGNHPILDLLNKVPISIDALAREVSKSPSELGPILTDLELKGQILRHPGNKVSRAS